MLRVEIPDGCDDEICAGQTLGWTDTNNPHARGASGGHSRRSILNHHTMAGRYVEGRGGGLEHLGVGFGTFRFVRIDHGIEQRPETEPVQYLSGVPTGGCHRESRAGGAKV